MGVADCGYLVLICYEPRGELWGNRQPGRCSHGDVACGMRREGLEFVRACGYGTASCVTELFNLRHT